MLNSQQVENALHEVFGLRPTFAELEQFTSLIDTAEKPEWRNPKIAFVEKITGVRVEVHHRQYIKDTLPEKPSQDFARQCYAHAVKFGFRGYQWLEWLRDGKLPDRRPNTTPSPGTAHAPVVSAEALAYQPVSSQERIATLNRLKAKHV